MGTIIQIQTSGRSPVRQERDKGSRYKLIVQQRGEKLERQGQRWRERKKKRDKERASLQFLNYCDYTELYMKVYSNEEMYCKLLLFTQWMLIMNPD